MTVYHAKEHEKESERRLGLQKQEYEATIKRHLSFIDQVCVCVCVCLSVCLSICLSVCLSMYAVCYIMYVTYSLLMTRKF